MSSRVRRSPSPVGSPGGAATRLVVTAPITDGSIMASDVDRRPATWVAKKAARRRRLVWLGLALFFLLDGLVLTLAVGHRLSLAGSAFFLAFVFAAKPHAEGFV